LSIARTGAGKGVSTIIPALLTYPGPVIVIDPKGENFLVTRRWREQTLGQRIYAIDPFGVLDKHAETLREWESHGLNVFDPALSARKIEKADSLSLARLIASVDPQQSKDPFWDNSAQDLLAGIIHDTLTSPDIPQGERTISTVLSTAARSPLELYVHGRLTYSGLSPDVATSYQAFIGNHPDVMRSIRSTMSSYLAVFNSASLRDSLSTPDVDMELVRDGEDFTIYVIIPPEKLMSHSRVLRLIVGSLLGKIIQRNHIPDYRTLFLLDECAQLGSFDELRQAVTLLRGYGLQVWMFFQDLSQLERLYSQDWRTLVNNCGVVQVFGMSRKSESAHIAGILNTITEEEIGKIDQRQQILSIEGEPDRVSGLMNYLSDPAFAGRWDSNPYYRNKLA
jgi:type IV secretion system protein VirD4